KATKLTKRHIWLTSWSKMRVDLAEHTLSKEVEDTLASIEELKEISEGTQDFIKYSQNYRQIIHSKIGFRSIEDPRINTLREIRDWFVRGDKQKTKPTQWISSQCQFDLILSID
ncbi:20264_t:CDS:2, partial [Dentiscutata erythropus]